jgi:uncharacterized protein (DUF2267 family)
VFYEGWNPSKTPETYRDRDTFLLRLAEAATLAGPTEASVAAEAATDVLAEQISAGEMDDVLQVLPTAVREVIWPARSREAT